LAIPSLFFVIGPPGSSQEGGVPQQATRSIFAVARRTGEFLDELRAVLREAFSRQGIRLALAGKIGTIKNSEVRFLVHTYVA
jgi:hypothetical protein